ncbi:hypothetical protein BURPS668_1598 [Burkholderia pseudomallei 668]|nr:hypothetical protein BURPS668_1598 [Burkholderia pseudomallei 668]
MLSRAMGFLWECCKNFCIVFYFYGVLDGGAHISHVFY